jgi:hypothetical protein
MAKKKFDLFSRLEHAERKLESAKSPKEVDALKERIKNIMKMLEDDYDYGKFKTGGKVYSKNQPRKVSYVD